MAIGQFLTVRNYGHFEQVVRDVTVHADMDPAMVFETALPGFLADLYRDEGIWPARNQVAFEWPSGQGRARAISPNQRSRMGGYNVQQVVALPGMELAGETQSVYPSDFQYGGMRQDEVTRRGMRPRLDWNATTFEKALDVATQGGKSTGAPIESFAWSVLDQSDNTVSKSQVTETSLLARDVVANAGQSILWPNRQGGTFAANHDHVVNNAGAAWTPALGRAHRNLVLEHPGNGNTVRSIVGSAVATSIQAALVIVAANTERAYNITVQPLNVPDNLGGTTPIATVEGVDYFSSPDMDANQAIYYAPNKKPFYFSKGQKGVDGNGLATGSWFDNENPETRGTLYGYRDYLNLGTADPTAVAIVDYVA